MHCGVKPSEVESLWVETIVSQAAASQAIAAHTIIGWAVEGVASMKEEVVMDHGYLTIPQVIIDWAF